ncbi:MAG: hypothetical protein CMIDDMOC_00324 [Sodalis sp. Fle]|nr:MAG: hypothetical protein CMIDDMOC_00324 [Sodalis sp. Fle]
MFIAEFTVKKLACRCCIRGLEEVRSVCNWYLAWAEHI